MSKIFVIMGKSATGKDTIFKKLVQNKYLNLKTVVSYTTRPMRCGEKDGVEYFYVNIKRLEELLKENKVIEHRSYNTCHGVWNYFMVNDDQIELDKWNYIMIGTLESYEQIRKYFGMDKVYPIYLEVDDGIRLERALAREKMQQVPLYVEMCRRFIADEEDFSKDKILKQGIIKTYNNLDVTLCLKQIIEDISQV